MSTHLLRLHIERPGTPMGNAQGGFDLSLTGHTWFEVVSPGGQSLNAGFAPENAKSGVFSVPGKVFSSDGQSYSGLSTFTATYAITASQAQTLDKFRRDPSRFNFDRDHYHALENSCVDFVWKGLEVIGMNPKKYEGKLAPMDNIQAFSKLKNPASAMSGVVNLQYFSHPYWDLMHNWVKSSSGKGFRLRTPEERFWEGDTSIGLPEGTVTIGPLGGTLSSHRARGAGSFIPLSSGAGWGIDFGSPTITVGPLGSTW